MVRTPVSQKPAEKWNLLYKSLEEKQGNMTVFVAACSPQMKLRGVKDMDGVRSAFKALVPHYKGSYNKNVRSTILLLKSKSV